jgi:phosphoglycolate phosphatase
VDSAETSYRCYERVFARFGIGFDRARFEATYSPNWRKTYVALGLPEERWAEADALWLEEYATRESALLPGARTLLEQLRGRGLQQGIVSSGDRARVTGELARHALEAFFGVVVCGGDTPRRKPHPEALVLALERLGLPPAAAAYVGDSPEDVEMARAAGVFSVGVPGGFPNRETLRAARPDVIAASLEHVASALVARL